MREVIFSIALVVVLVIHVVMVVIPHKLMGLRKKYIRNEDAIEYLLYTETLDVMEKWEVIKHILDESIATEADFLYNKVAKYKLRRTKLGS